MCLRIDKPIRYGHTKARRYWRQMPTPSGFTLIEVVVSMTILGIAIIGLFEVYSLSIRSSSQASNLDAAVVLAQNQMAVAISELGNRPPESRGENGRYRWTLTMTEKPEGLMLLTVVVSWTESGEDRLFQLNQLCKIPAPASG